MSWVIEIDEKTYKRVWLELSKVSEVCQLSSDGQSRATVQSTVDERNIPHTSMFRAVLFIIAKIYKQPKCPSTDEWINRVWYAFLPGESPWTEELGGLQPIESKRVGHD